MIKKILFASLFVITTVHLNAQTFFDDFESYTVGSKLAASSPDWKTWTLPYTANEDVAIVNTNSSSGTNSIYFASNNGGPTDVVLPFASLYNTGTFEIGMKLNVTNAKQAYFNLQKTATAGQTWALDVTFKNNGTLELTNYGAMLFSTTYTQGVWFDFKLSINLNNSSWSVIIDGNTVGSFQNSTFQIASMNIYSIQNCSFYVDDVMYDYTPYTLPSLNASLAVLTMPNGLVGQSVKPTLTVRNLGQQTITSYKVDALYDGTTYSQTVTSLSLASGAETQLEMNQNITLVSGTQTLTCTIMQVNDSNDDDATDNMKSISITPILPATGKIVVGEEGTGTWCGWCPRGAVFMDLMESTYGDYFAGIAVHNDDPMTIAEYDTPLGANFSGYPSALVDRGSDIDPSAFENDFVTRVQVAPKAILINGAEYDANTNTLKVSIKTTAVLGFSGNYKIACVLTEDGVKGTGSGWSQSNYYSGGSNGVMGGYELLQNPVPAALMVYDHVARAISPSFSGQPNAFGTATVGNEFVHNFTFTIPATWKLDSMHIIGLFIDPTGKIDNASKSTYQQAVSNGFLPGIGVGDVDLIFEGNQSQIHLFPNPAVDISVLELDIVQPTDVTVSVLRMDGVLVQSRTYSSLSGFQKIPMQLYGLNSGCYIIQVTSADIQEQLMLIKQ